ncbi:hypothetical protein ACQR1I_03920 [Bradyrhizobium sp. HKCCYLS2038]|uniref:hypothetical protein n=1 Tax=unclassified Bradyrhizobium TaxID=2631580 RepID=UPI003EBC1925
MRQSSANLLGSSPEAGAWLKCASKVSKSRLQSINSDEDSMAKKAKKAAKATKKAAKKTKKAAKKK